MYYSPPSSAMKDAHNPQFDCSQCEGRARFHWRSKIWPTPKHENTRFHASGRAQPTLLTFVPSTADHEAPVGPQGQPQPSGGTIVELRRLGANRRTPGEH